MSSSIVRKLWSPKSPTGSTGPGNWFEHSSKYLLDQFLKQRVIGKEALCSFLPG